MEGHYQYPQFDAFHGPDPLPFEHGFRLYAPDDGHAIETSVPNAMISFSSAPDAAAKGAVHLSAFDALRYPPPPSAVEFSSWHHVSAFDGSVRSISPQTDSQSSQCLSALPYDDAMSCSSGFASSPSPSYHDPVPLALYEQEPVSASSEPSPSMMEGPSPYTVYSSQPPIEYASPTSSSSSSSNESSNRPGRTASSRKRSKRTTGVQKRSKPQKKTPARSSKSRANPDTTSKSTAKKLTDRRFECCFARYGCTITFPSKNEWKRHVSSQHIQLGFYRCDVDRCSLNNIKHQDPSHSPTPSSPRNTQPQTPTLLVNDFNRKDLFVQHQRRMHAPWVVSKNRSKQSVSEEERNAFEASLEKVSKRCWKQLRFPPTFNRCGFCAMEFHGQDAWKERMEHVARHFEKADPGPQEEDVPLREWAAEQGIIRFVNGAWKLATLCGN
ncbi:putative C2H2 finger domain protein [Aspergillus lucknowensis]|uniref:C2H2 finger domain protein n=1 Tax=Aspergillus lucknowensis TaxID=176173 RepID=A0ABR4L8R2_9EURO